MKASLLLLIIIAASVAVPAQAKPAKPVAQKFDEFTLETSLEGRWKFLRFRAEHLTKRMLLEKGKYVILIGYRSHVSYGNSIRTGADVAGELRRQLPFGIASDQNIFVINGGIRENESIEIWFVPQGDELPSSTPEFSVAEAINCPAITIDVLPVGSEGKKFDFVAQVPTDISGDKLKWSVSGGEIVARFPDRITVVELGGGGKRATVFLEVADLPMPCNDRYLATALFGVRPRLIESFGMTTIEHVQAMLDRYFMELSNNPSEQGVIHIYGSRIGGVREIAARERLILSQIRVRNFDVSRVTIVKAGFREEMQTDFWMVGPGAENPVPKPTLDKRFVEILRR